MEINENGQHLHGWQEAQRVRNHKHCLTGSAQGASQLQCEAEANSQRPAAGREDHQGGQILKAKERFESIPHTFQ